MTTDPQWRTDKDAHVPPVAVGQPAIVWRAGEAYLDSLHAASPEL